jgi:hypothetical protein
MDVGRSAEAPAAERRRAAGDSAKVQCITEVTKPGTMVMTARLARAVKAGWAASRCTAIVGRAAAVVEAAAVTTVAVAAVAVAAVRTAILAAAGAADRHTSSLERPTSKIKKERRLPVTAKS